MSIAQAQHWLKTVVSGQPIHRDDLGAEDDSSGTLRGVSPATLELAPQLQRELSQELAAAPKQELKISAPSMGMGGNSSGGVQPSGMNNRAPKPPTDSGRKD
ncbi:MAG: hypothetical protein COB76_02885 [Alphaproteobacteria bacterium]|nr:MAG: hypothetical protein COB76_02885 [Alphaproteobacteria bacterium]